VLHLRPLGHATLPGYSTTRTPAQRKSTGQAGSRATPPRGAPTWLSRTSTHADGAQLQ